MYGCAYTSFHTAGTNTDDMQKLSISLDHTCDCNTAAAKQYIRCSVITQTGHDRIVADNVTGSLALSLVQRSG